MPRLTISQKAGGMGTKLYCSNASKYSHPTHSVCYSFHYNPAARTGRTFDSLSSGTYEMTPATGHGARRFSVFPTQTVRQICPPKRLESCRQYYPLLRAPGGYPWRPSISPLIEYFGQRLSGASRLPEAIDRTWAC